MGNGEREDSGVACTGNCLSKGPESSIQETLREESPEELSWSREGNEEIGHKVSLT